MYDIPAFSPHFEPENHNEFTRRRADFLARNNEKMLLEGILRRKVEENYRGIFEKKFTWKQLLWEILLLGEADIVTLNSQELKIFISRIYCDPPTTDHTQSGIIF